MGLAFSPDGCRLAGVAVERAKLPLGDEITGVEAANLATFEGGLFRVDEGKCAMLYNEQLSSPGRIRFTQAHELGHFLVHRLLQDEFQCSQSEVGGYEAERKKVEAEADEFASTLLMPVKQFRASVAGQAIDLDVLSAASNKVRPAAGELDKPCYKDFHRCQAGVFVFSLLSRLFGFQ